MPEAGIEESRVVDAEFPHHRIDCDHLGLSRSLGSVQRPVVGEEGLREIYADGDCSEGDGRDLLEHKR